MQDIGDLGPEVFDGIVQIPWFGECSAIAFQFFGSHGAVLGTEMLKHGEWCEIAESEIRVFKGTEK